MQPYHQHKRLVHLADSSADLGELYLALRRASLVSMNGVCVGSFTSSAHDRIGPTPNLVVPPAPTSPSRALRKSYSFRTTMSSSSYWVETSMTSTLYSEGVVVGTPKAG